MKKSLFCIVAILFFVTGLNASSSKIADYTYKIEMELIPARPKIGQVINVKWKVSGDKSATNAYASINTFGAPAEIVEIVSPLKGNGTVDNENKGIKFSITKGEVKTFEASIIIHSAPHALLYNKAKSVGFSLGVLSYDKINGKGIGVCADPRKQLYLIDKATGQLGTLSDWDEMVNGPLKLRKIFWKYNHIDGEWLNVPDQSFEITNRQIAANMKTLEPALTDSEALCLHADNIKLIVNAVGDPKATDDERIKILLSKGWLKAQREGSSVKEKWFINFIKSNNGKWDRSSTDPQFFRDDVNNGAIVCNSSGGDGSKLSTTFVGYWKYQDHIYDLDKLQFAYNVKPVKNAEVGIRAYWSGQGAIWVGWGTTGDDGSFTISTELIPSGATSVRAYPILFTWGPDRFSELLKVSDPVSLFSTWRSPRDTTIWFEPRSDSPLANVLAPGGLCDFGICWPETTTSVRHQPKSGAVNI